MVLVSASPARLELRRRAGFQAPLLTAALFGLFALSPLVAPGPVTARRAAFALALALVAVGLGALARIREKNIQILLDAGVIEAGERTIPLARARGLALTSGGSTLEASAFTRYRAELTLDGGERLVVLEGPDPARVLADLRELLVYLPLPVTPGWDLPPGIEPWQKQSAAEPHAAEATVEERGRPGESELGAGICVLGGALIIATAMGLMHGARISRGDATSFFSYLLSAVLLGFVLVLGVFMVTDRVTARLEPDGLTVVRRALGITWSRWQVPSRDLRGLFATGLVPGEPRHLVVESSERLFSIRFFGPGAARFAARARSELSPQS